MTEEKIATDLFLSLTAERVLEAVEFSGLRCKPVCFPLNSFENRVYLMELEDDTPICPREGGDIADGDHTKIVSKFYRPQRWTREQILEEHQFLADLLEAEVPVCPTLPFPDGGTLREIDGIFYCLFERRGGRAPDELSDNDAERLGMLVARLHNVGAKRTADHRIHLTAETYVWEDVAWLEEHDALPVRLAQRYLDASAYIAEVAEDYLRDVEFQRIHGDFHLGNILTRGGVFNVLDFDDMVVGPPVQDLWLALPGRDQYTLRQRQAFLEGYERFRAFDRSTLRLIEPLRGLRMVHYATWLARRWHDPIFPRTWPHFGTEEYWEEETSGLEEIVELLKNDRGEVTQFEEVPVLSNKDYFYDMDD